LCYLDVGGVLVGLLDLREPVSGWFGEVFGLRDEPQHLRPAWMDEDTKTPAVTRIMKRKLMVRKVCSDEFWLMRQWVWTRLRDVWMEVKG